MSDNLEHETIQTNGINLHVVFAGPQGGKPVILLHGFPEFWESMQQDDWLTTLRTSEDYMQVDAIRLNCFMF